jgi:DNA polymerase-3 subunit beta
MLADDYPGFPAIEVERSVEIPFNEFAEMVKRVARVVSRDETRAILTGVFITVVDGKLRMVATDSYRLALSDNAKVSGLGEFGATISGAFLREIASLPASEMPVTLAVSYNQIMVRYQDITYINRRLEGNFPNYRQLLPDSHNTRVTFNVKELQAALRRTSLLSSTSAPVKFDINIASQTALLSAISQDVGSVQEIVRVQAEGDDVVIAFNSAFAQDGLQAIPTAETYLDIQNSMRPGIFRSTGDEDFLYLIMPVRLPS